MALAVKSTMNNDHLKTLDAILKEPLSGVRTALHEHMQKFTPAYKAMVKQKDPAKAEAVAGEIQKFADQHFNEEHFNAYMGELRKFAQNDMGGQNLAAFDREAAKAREAIETGDMTFEPNASVRVNQLVWAVTLSYLTANPKAQDKWPDKNKAFDITDSKVWNKVLQSDTLEDELLDHAFHLSEEITNKDTKLRWGAPGSWFYNNREEPAINLDLIESLTLGLEHTRAAAYHEMGHNKLTVKLPQSMLDILGKLEEQDEKVSKGAKLTEDEYVERQKLAAEMQARHKIFNVCEDNTVNQYAVRQSVSLDYSVSINYTNVLLAGTGTLAKMVRQNGGEPVDLGGNTPVSQHGTGDIVPGGADDVSEAQKKFDNLQHALNMSFFQHNGLFPDTEKGWKSVNVRTDWITEDPSYPGATGQTPQEALKHIQDLCHQLEDLQPASNARRFGEDAVKKMIPALADKRIAIYEEIWERYAKQFAEPLIEKAEEQAKENADQQQGDGKDGDPSDQKSDSSDKSDKQKGDKSDKSDKSDSSDKSDKSDSSDKSDDQQPSDKENDGQDSKDGNDKSDQKDQQKQDGQDSKDNKDKSDQQQGQDDKNQSDDQQPSDKENDGQDSKDGNDKSDQKDQQKQDGQDSKDNKDKSDQQQDEQPSEKENDGQDAKDGDNKSDQKDQQKQDKSDQQKGDQGQQDRDDDTVPVEDKGDLPDNASKENRPKDPVKEEQERQQKEQEAKEKAEQEAKEQAEKDAQDSKDGNDKENDGQDSKDGNEKDDKDKGDQKDGDEKGDKQEGEGQEGEGQDAKDGEEKGEEQGEGQEGEGQDGQGQDGEGQDGEGQEGEGQDAKDGNGKDGNSKDGRTLDELNKEREKRQKEAAEKAAKEAAEKQKKKQQAEEGEGEGQGEGSGSGHSLADLKVGDWRNYDEMKREYASPIREMSNILLKIREKKVIYQKERSREHSLKPEDGKLGRFDGEKYTNRIKKERTGQETTAEDYKTFHKDQQSPKPAPDDIVIAIDLSGSMASGTRGARPVDIAVQIACIMREAGKKADTDVYILGWGEKGGGRWIATPGMDDKQIGDNIDGIKDAASWGTDFAPAVNKIIDMYVDEKKGTHAVVGDTHIVVASDGDLFDEQQSNIIVSRMLKSCPNVTMDVAIINKNTTSNMAKMVQTQKGQRHHRQINVTHTTGVQESQDKMREVMTERLRVSAEAEAIPHAEKQIRFKQAKRGAVQDGFGR